MFGARADETSRDHIGIQAAIDWAISKRRGSISLLPGKYKLGKSIRIPAGQVNILGDATILDFTEMKAGCAVFIEANERDELSPISRIENIKLLGPSGDDSQLDGIYIDRSNSAKSGNSAHITFQHVFISGFRDSVFLGKHVWLLKWIACSFMGFRRYGLNSDSTTNAGENTTILGGVFANGRNARGHSTAIYCSEAGNADIYAFGVSFDYCDIVASINSGSLDLHGCHVENSNPSPQFEVYNARLSIFGGNIGSGPFGALPIEPIGGRKTFIEVTGSRSVVTIRDCTWLRYGTPDSSLVEVISGFPTLLIDGVDPNVKANMVPRISGYTERLGGNQWAEGKVAPWRESSGDESTTLLDILKSKSTARHGVCLTGGPNRQPCLSIESQGGTPHGLYRQITIAPGRKLMVRGYVKIERWRSGSAGLRLSFHDEAGTYLAWRDVSGTGLLKASTAYTQQGGTRTAPPGTQSVRIWCWTDDAFDGSAFFCDIEAWVL